MDNSIIKTPEWLDAISIQITESAKTDKSINYNFKATALVWDSELDNKWSIKSRNGRRYNREKTIAAFKQVIEQNKGIPVMYNHIIDEKTADQLGLITSFEDTGDKLKVSGKLNGKKTRVIDEIVPGFLNNVSIQVDGSREQIDEADDSVTYVNPTDVYEVSFVPVNGIVGANTLELALAESVSNANKRLIKQAAEDVTTSNTASATKLVGTDDEDKTVEPKVTSSAENQEALTKAEIEEELQGIEEQFDMTTERLTELHNQALAESSTISMDEIQVSIGDVQIAKGIKIEEKHEATYNWLATELATSGKLPSKEDFFRKLVDDNLREIADYYTRSEEVEKNE